MNKSAQVTKRGKRMSSSVLATIELVASFISGVSLFVLMLLVCLDTFLRYIFNNPISGVFEVSCILLMVVVFFPVSRLQAHKKHIVVSVVYSLLPAKTQKVISVVTSILAFAIFFAMTWKGGEFAWQAIQMKEYTPGIVEVPLWPGKMVVPLSAGFLCIRVVADIFRHIGNINLPKTKLTAIEG